MVYPVTEKVTANSHLWRYRARFFSLHLSNCFDKTSGLQTADNLFLGLGAFQGSRQIDCEGKRGEVEGKEVG